MKKLKFKQKQHRKILLIVAVAILLITSVAGWLIYRGGQVSASQVKAETAVKLLKNRDLSRFMTLTEGMNDRNRMLIYSLIMQRLHGDYQLIQSEQRTSANNVEQASYIFYSKEGREAPYIRVLLEERQYTWVVTGVLTAASKPSPFPAS